MNIEIHYIPSSSLLYSKPFPSLHSHGAIKKKKKLPQICMMHFPLFPPPFSRKNRNYSMTNNYVIHNPHIKIQRKIRVSLSGVRPCAVVLVPERGERGRPQ